MKEKYQDLEANWKKRYRIKSPLWSTISANNPEHGLLATNESGETQLYAWYPETGEKKQLTFFPTGKMFGLLSPDGKFVYYLKDEGSNEIGHFVRVPFEGGKEEDITPDLDPYASFDIQISKNTNLAVMLVSNRAGFKLYSLDLNKEELPSPRLLASSQHLMRSLSVSSDGKFCVSNSIEKSKKLQTNLLAVDIEKGERKAELWDGEGTSLEVVAFSPVDKDHTLLATTNKSGFNRPLLWNPETGERKDIELTELEGDISPLCWSPDGSKILLQQFNRAIQQLYVYDINNDKLKKLDHENGTFAAFLGLGTYFAGNNEIYTHFQTSITPTQVIALDADTGKQTRVIIPADDVPESIPWKSIEFPSSDGEMIQAWLAVPKGAGPFATIVQTHGGPTSVRTESFDPQAQAWLDHGFAYVSINYRGSTTFGKEFQDKIIENLGHWEVEDVKACLDHIIEKGIADPKRILKTGWSYGGYMTLMSLGKLPEYFAGGMAGIAVADWVLMYEDQAETLRGYQVALFGGTPEEKPEQHKISSPITYVEHIKAPLLIIQGKNDTRCPVRQMNNYLDKMEELNKPYKIRWFEAGHGSLKIEESIEFMELMLSFAYEVLE